MGLERIFKTIKKYKLIKSKDKIFVGVSGGKDSLVALYSLKKYAEENNIRAEITAFHINLGFSFSQKIEEIVKKQTKEVGVKLVILRLKHMEINILKISRKKRRPICSVCGLAKRYLLNRVPRELGASKIATGHNMDDFLSFFFKNLINKNLLWSSKFKPFLASDHPKLLPKIRPLFFTSEEESREIAKKLGLPILTYREICPYAKTSNKSKWFKFLACIDENTKKQMIESISEMEFESVKKGGIRECKVCGEPTNQEVCGFCRTFGIKDGSELAKKIKESINAYG